MRESERERVRERERERGRHWNIETLEMSMLGGKIQSKNRKNSADLFLMRFMMKISMPSTRIAIRIPVKHCHNTIAIDILVFYSGYYLTSDLWRVDHKD